ncbi:DUF4870 domain-containing protein [Microbacterium sp. EYE_5]|uniref:DUF4870 domain-containing protein n=1 Tax=unclassified Microbacterium TaxID=2609290 RepID=UPI002002A381|nr:MULTISPECIES: DUF4870 domain-containing protein [unclassified Microbacterium]MCK6081393.1 DUF4870 domain-containing protein [Microbacterium sp. EYE_382]MCK6086663.1 DUF4870 domain-containing protein [Microbacterium sp. EYE_384]MCK6123839.1 DUF4870 domain-containing protein [Microbacterium sp. EYE_80]MCK6126748.1 DUF4870 domain-containing protein [Microbacterium sp. EYE_79]MCK6142348.1 DUF4870 domain-containing protein [Microbacterium sp. EYE_39]
MTDPNTPPPADGTPTPPPGAPASPPAGYTSPPPGGYTTPPPGAAPQQPYGQPGYAAAPGAPLTQEQDKQWAMWAHLGGILFVLPPLIIWLVFKDRGPRVNGEGKESVNWQITFLIIYVAAIILTSILSIIPFAGLVTWILPFGVWVANVIFCVQGGMKANAGGSYRYPFNFRFIK